MAPMIIQQLAAMTLYHPKFDVRVPGCVDFNEYFAGKKRTTVQHERDGQVAVPYDIDYDDHFMNINDDMGFLVALYLALSGRIGGSALLAVVCSTWVFMNMGTSGRSRLLPLGRRDYIDFRGYYVVPLTIF
jgi:hypothetical protein